MDSILRARNFIGHRSFFRPDFASYRLQDWRRKDTRKELGKSKQRNITSVSPTCVYYGQVCNPNLPDYRRVALEGRISMYIEEGSSTSAKPISNASWLSPRGSRITADRGILYISTYIISDPRKLWIKGRKSCTISDNNSYVIKHSIWLRKHLSLDANKLILFNYKI